MSLLPRAAYQTSASPAPLGSGASQRAVSPVQPGASGSRRSRARPRPRPGTTPSTGHLTRQTWSRSWAGGACPPGRWAGGGTRGRGHGRREEVEKSERRGRRRDRLTSAFVVDGFSSLSRSRFLPCSPKGSCSRFVEELSRPRCSRRGWVTGSWTAEARAPARRIRRLQRAGGGGGKSEPGRFGALVFCPRGLFSPRRLCNKKYKLSLSPPPSSGSVPLRGDVDRPTASGLTLCGCG